MKQTDTTSDLVTHVQQRRTNRQEKSCFMLLGLAVAAMVSISGVARAGDPYPRAPRVLMLDNSTAMLPDGVNDIVIRLGGTSAMVFNRFATDDAVSPFSIPGDVNIDIVVDSFDVQSMIDGWLYKQLFASIDSCTLADLNLDGKTTLSDAFILHEVLLANGQPGASFSRLGQPVLEPVTCLLGLLGTVALLTGWPILRRRKNAWVPRLMKSDFQSCRSFYGIHPLNQPSSWACALALVTAILPFVSFLWSPTMVFGADVQENFNYQSTVSTDDDGALDLLAELNYDNAFLGAPIAVVMHGYSPSSGNLGNVRPSAQRLRDNGFFAISVAMRGRDGSDGTRDSGGIEIYDIYDAVESVKAAYPTLVDPSNVHITGYSGGGGNTMSALTKFPDYFRAGSSFFGMSDYGFHPTNGWYNNGAGGRTSRLDIDVGNPNTGGPAVLDRYHARASNLASKNNPYSEIHLFVNDNETISPKINSTSYRVNAVVAETFSGEFDNITAHIGGLGVYEDFDNDLVDDANELQNWPHSFPTANQQDAAELWYRDRLLSGTIPQPVLNASDELFVAGFVKTKPFEIWLGDGQNTAGLLNYSLESKVMTFTLEILSSDHTQTGKLSVNTEGMIVGNVNVLLDGELVDSSFAGDVDGIYEYVGLKHNETLQLELELFAKGDLDFDGDIDPNDHAIFTAGLHTDLSSLSSFEAYIMGDMNEDNLSNGDDFLLFRDIYDTANGAGALAALQATPVPEPTTMLLQLFGAPLVVRLKARGRVHKPPCIFFQTSDLAGEDRHDSFKTLVTFPVNKAR